ncbi:MAG: hypothetical protein ABFD89_01570 [Bryobacteraceae bacterium]
MAEIKLDPMFLNGPVFDIRPKLADRIAFLIDDVQFALRRCWSAVFDRRAPRKFSVGVALTTMSRRTRLG